jgi:NADPH2:quinone reductase
VSDTTLAALVDPGFSAWAALKSRAHFAAGETVLVNGATGTAGSMAVQIARHLGASKVIATSRNAAALERIRDRGADLTLLLQSDNTSLDAAYDEQFDAGVDVVLDYLWGSSAERLLNAAAKAQRRPLRFVQIGAVSSESLTLDARVLRHSSIDMLGCSALNVSSKEIAASVSDLIGAASTANFAIDITACPLERIGDVWSHKSATPRIVFSP